jgi:hypothetical protein
MRNLRCRRGCLSGNVGAAAADISGMKTRHAHWLHCLMGVSVLALVASGVSLPGCATPESTTIVVPSELVPFLKVESNQVSIPANAVAEIAPLHAGDILVIAGDPNSDAPMAAALRRVGAISRGNNGELIVSTTQAAIGDVIHDAKVTSSFTVAPPKASGDARTLGRSLGGIEAGLGRFRMSLPSDSAKIEVTQAHVLARPDLELDLAIENGGIQRLGAILSGQIEASLSVEVNMQAGATRALDVPLIKQKGYFVQMVGWVPVVWVTELTIGVGIEVHSVTESHFELGGTVSAQLRGGATWTPAGWESIGDAQFDATPTGAGLTNDGTYDVRTYAYVKVDIQLFDAAGPYFTVRPYVAERREPGSPAIRTAGLQGVFGAEIAVPVFDLSLASYEVTLFNPNMDLPMATPAGCGDLDYRGECEQGVARWCSGGEIKEVDCPASGRGCGWVDDTAGNFCKPGCGDLDFAGTCLGDDVRWCENGKVSNVSCSNGCAWDGNATWYACQ